VMSESGFNLHKWNSNSPSLLTMINSEQSNQKPRLEANRVKELEPEPDKLLGIQWFHEADKFRFCYKLMPIQQTNSTAYNYCHF